MHRDSWSLTNRSMEPLHGYCLEVQVLGRGEEKHVGLAVNFYARLRDIANALIFCREKGSTEIEVGW